MPEMKFQDGDSFIQIPIGIPQIITCMISKSNNVYINDI